MIYTFKFQGYGDIGEFDGQRIDILRLVEPGEFEYTDLTTMARFPNGTELPLRADEITGHSRDFDLDAMIEGYVECALWADYMPEPTDEEPEPELGGGNDLGLRPDDASTKRIHETCESFFNFHAADCMEYVERMVSENRLSGWDDGTPESYLGHDLWLTSHGHGAGFWDRGLGALGDRLTEASKPHATSSGVAMSNGDGLTVEIN